MIHNPRPPAASSLPPRYPAHLRQPQRQTGPRPRHVEPRQRAHLHGRHRGRPTRSRTTGPDASGGDLQSAQQRDHPVTHASAAGRVSTAEAQSSSCSLSPSSSRSSCSRLPPGPPSNGDESLHAEENVSAPVVASTRPTRTRTVRVRVEVVMNGQTTRKRKRGHRVSPTGPFSVATARSSALAWDDSFLTGGSAGGVPLAADSRLCSLDGGAPQGCDHFVGRALGHLHQREAIGDLDRPDVTASETGLPSYRADQVLWADPGAAPDTEKDPRHPPCLGTAAPPLAPIATPDLALGHLGDLGDLLFVGFAPQGLVSQLHRSERHIHDIELVSERLDDDAEALQVVGEQAFLQR